MPFEARVLEPVSDERAVCHCALPACWGTGVRLCVIRVFAPFKSTSRWQNREGE